MTAWCYQIDGVLIDTGIRHLRQTILERMADDKPEMILVTHHHEDHSGNAGVICNALGIPAYGHPETAKILKMPFKIRP